MCCSWSFRLGLLVILVSESGFCVCQYVFLCILCPIFGLTIKNLQTETHSENIWYRCFWMHFKNNKYSHYLNTIVTLQQDADLGLKSTTGIYEEELIYGWVTL